MSAGDVRAFAPATVANLGLGFDVLGLAIADAGDVVTARLAPGSGVRVVAIRGDGGRLPTDPARNTAGVAAQSVLRTAGMEHVGVELEIDKGLPLGSGLGSSAASAAAAAVAVNALLKNPLRRAELVPAAIDAEAVVSGRHADNVAPSLLGGLILVRSMQPLDLVRLPLPNGTSVAVVTPAFEVETKAARSILPRAVDMSDLVASTANIAALTCACFTQDFELMARCFEEDAITKARAGLVPGCRDVIRAALDAGALGSAISGAGPSVFALARSAPSAVEIAEAMLEAFGSAGLEAEARVSPAECPGAKVL